MRAALIYGAGDVRVEEVPDAALREPTDALVRVVKACICAVTCGPTAPCPPLLRAGGLGTSSSAWWSTSDPKCRA